MSSLKPYHRRTHPTKQELSLSTVLAFEPSQRHIDLSHAHLPPYPGSLRAIFESLGLNRVSEMAQSIGFHWPPPPTISLRDLIDYRRLANFFFDRRAAAAVLCSVGYAGAVRIQPNAIYREWQKDTAGFHTLDPDALLEKFEYWDQGYFAPTIAVLADKCLAAMAFADYFSDDQLPENLQLQVQSLRPKVSRAIMEASPGWCGTYGPDPGDQGQLHFEGNYEFNQNFMLPVVYNYYDELTPEAQEKLITELLAWGRIQRVNVNDTFTSGGAPNDWSRAGYASFVGNVHDIPETENHVLGIGTARYLTNQLLYQRRQDPNYDNRRNGCMQQLLYLMRNYLSDDFAEYNAKNYQEETRHPLLNLCSYAYDSEIRLGARMVLDYVSAHIAISSNDLRRMVPFRRRSVDLNVTQIDGKSGFMDVSLLDSHGADPMSAHFALLAGNTRAYQNRDARIWQDGKPNRIWDWAITANFSDELTLEAVSDYRLPPSIHDLFVNDLHRRFFQRLHRRPMKKEPGGQRNCDNMEIYSGSPSYLITAGGRPADYVIEGFYGGVAGLQAGGGYDDQNLGVAVPTSLMTAGASAGVDVNPNEAAQLIQLSQFSNKYALEQYSDADGKRYLFYGTENYGVAPDFACGLHFHIPTWVRPDGVGQDEVWRDKDGVFFVEQGLQDGNGPGFYLAIIKQGPFVLFEVFDIWLYPHVSYEQFKSHVWTDNSHIELMSGQQTIYTTYFGNQIHFVIWDHGDFDAAARVGAEGAQPIAGWVGSKILYIEYGAGDPVDTLAGAGNDQSQFLSGTILNSAGDGLVEIRNPFLGTTITLDWRDLAHPVRISETGEVEEAGHNNEVWVDPDSNGPFFEGDFFHPFRTIADAVNVVADGGVVKIVPGRTGDRRISHGGKRVRLVAPIGNVNIGGAR
ncbi:hypothetical protein [Paraburkholderia mimosarum]|uniref:hypothetical protein n=1 Tax=Paraburkholderia mimosarum TaxID=312026 RepID=UPI000423DD8D|nr:hypothetical protein [Paraburkholderia mimosarum]